MDKRTRQGGVALALVLWVLAALTAPQAGHPREVTAQGPAAAASAPHSVFYQGYVTLSGAPYDGTGYFKFAVVNQKETVVYWSNDGTLGVPTVSVPIEVLDGYFSVLLGDTSLSGMRQALDPGVFEAPGRSLKVWFAASLSDPFNALSPVPIASAPYALNAETLDGLEANALVSTAAYAGGDQSVDLGLDDTVVRYVTITTPRSGRVIVSATGYGYLPGDTDYLRCSITTGTGLDTEALSIARGAIYFPFALMRGYTVGAGTHRFNLVCDANSDQVDARDTNITALYVPGSFATLASPDTGPAAAPIPQGCVDENEGHCGP
jgi:hypothetical protein